MIEIVLFEIDKTLPIAFVEEKIIETTITYCLLDVHTWCMFTKRNYNNEISHSFSHSNSMLYFCNNT